MPTPQSTLREKWDLAANDEQSSFSISDNKGNKQKLKKNKLKFKDYVAYAVGTLAVAIVVASSITLPEWKSRMDDVTAGIKDHTIDTKDQIVDEYFYANHGANFKESFLAGIDKIKNGAESALGIKSEPVAQQQTMAEKFKNFAEKQDPTVEKQKLNTGNKPKFN